MLRRPLSGQEASDSLLKLNPGFEDNSMTCSSRTLRENVNAIELNDKVSVRSEDLTGDIVTYVKVISVEVAAAHIGGICRVSSLSSESDIVGI